MTATSARRESGLVVLSTGGTGGHVFPAQALAAELSERGARLALVTDRRGDAFSGPLAALDSYQISAAGVSGRSLSAGMSAVFKLSIGFVQARRLLKDLRPDVVVGFGGYPSIPTMLAASRLKLKTAIHEQNAILGRANRLLAPRVDRIATSFETTAELRDADASKVCWTGNPVRPEIAALSGRPYPTPQGDSPFNILVFGGSQGAAVFGEIVPPALAKLPPSTLARLRVTQQVRAEQIPTIENAYRSAGIAAEIQTFFSDMPAQLDRTHLVICRAGASTIAELTAVGRPAVLVPYPHAIDDHQSANAARLSDAGGAWMYPQDSLTPDVLAERVRTLIEQPGALETAANCAARIGMPVATAQLTDVVCTLIAGNGASRPNGGPALHEDAA